MRAIFTKFRRYFFMYSGNKYCKWTPFPSQNFFLSQWPALYNRHHTAGLGSQLVAWWNMWLKRLTLRSSFSACSVRRLRISSVFLLWHSIATHMGAASFFFYRVIKKSLCTWWSQYRKLQVMFKVSPASLQTFIDTPNCVLEDRVKYSTPSVIPNSNYVIMVSDWNCLKYFCVFLYCHHQVHRDRDGWVVGRVGTSRTFVYKFRHKLCLLLENKANQYTETLHQITFICFSFAADVNKALGPVFLVNISIHQVLACVLLFQVVLVCHS
jgi:hypothetical protein